MIDYNTDMRTWSGSDGMGKCRALNIFFPDMKSSDTMQPQLPTR